MYTVYEENQKCILCDGMGYSRNKTSFDSGAFGSSTSTPSSGPTSGPTAFGPTFDGSFFDTLVSGGPPAADGNISCSALWLEFQESYPVIYIDRCAKLKNECIICDEMTSIINITETASFDVDNGPNAEDDIEI